MDNKNNFQYYNININNETNQELCSFSENRVEPILNKANEFEISANRLNIPSRNIPILLFEPIYSLSFKYLNNVFTQSLSFVPTIQQDVIPYILNGVYNYGDFIDSINTAFKLVFQTFQASPIYLTIPLLDRPTEPPVFVYNSNQLISLYCQPQYSVQKANPIFIYYDTNLFSFFHAFQNFGDERDSTLAHYFLVKDNFNNIEVINGNNYIRITQEFQSLFLFNFLQGILLETNTIPVNNELISAQRNITRTILMDFEKFQNNSINNNLPFQYFPQSNLQLYNLESNQELRRVDISVSWLSKTGEIFPIYISAGDLATVKLIFRRKGYLVSNIDFT
jgi:hypothetical protein